MPRFRIGSELRKETPIVKPVESYFIEVPDPDRLSSKRTVFELKKSPNSNGWTPFGYDPITREKITKDCLLMSVSTPKGSNLAPCLYGTITEIKDVEIFGVPQRVARIRLIYPIEAGRNSTDPNKRIMLRTPLSVPIFVPGTQEIVVREINTGIVTKIEFTGKKNGVVTGRLHYRAKQGSTVNGVPERFFQFSFKQTKRMFFLFNQSRLGRLPPGLNKSEIDRNGALNINNLPRGFERIDYELLMGSFSVIPGISYFISNSSFPDEYTLLLLQSSVGYSEKNNAITYSNEVEDSTGENLSGIPDFNRDDNVDISNEIQNLEDFDPLGNDTRVSVSSP